MALRLLKYFVFIIVVVFGLVASIGAFNYYFPPTYEAAISLPSSNSELAVQLEPMSPYFAEYRRSLILRTNGRPDIRVELFPDTGGYSRTQLYRLPNGLFLVRGFFDSVVIDASKHNLIVKSDSYNIAGAYLGAFDTKGDGGWRFVDANQSAEQSLVAGGGG
jgi:hypothetical protein